ncbi:MAG: type II toxin-antitoxin system VapC family toxin [Burkholderiales bacterium]|nr:type II toxin-antitoxin system VapC family toxin [Burkholderiales bacterium]
MAFVLDNSVAIAWFVNSQATAYSRRMSVRAERESLHAPAFWPLEFANSLWSLEKRKRLRAHEVDGIVVRAERLGVVLHGEPVPMRVLLEMSRQSGLAVYDTAYLELAQRFGLPLAAQDAVLRAAARRAGVPVL